ncbi:MULTISPECIES: hypothetical protein [Nostocales]|uniref:Uncharacterized protein n=3 Tax=Nostocales TaxID=1161 RepID=A0A8S9TBZ6_9CYAN|nr:hypothetical protein [Tolypothrix bouteillei]KAF3889925.1 hypothetical protein DA73_0400033985 [Tolypothrix bouteillei VB521301]
MPQITLLCEKFGYTLEHLSLSEKRLLRLILVNNVTAQSMYKPCSLLASLLVVEKIIDQITSKYPNNKDSVFVAIEILEGIDIDTTEGLIEILTRLIKVELIATADNLI